MMQQLKLVLYHKPDAHHLVRSYTQLGASVRFGKHGDEAKNGVVFPNPVDGSLIMSRVWVTEASGVVRGYIRFMEILFPYTLFFLQMVIHFPVVGFSWSNFEIIKVYQGALIIETSDTWYN